MEKAHWPLTYLALAALLLSHQVSVLSVRLSVRQEWTVVPKPPGFAILVIFSPCCGRHQASSDDPLLPIAVLSGPCLVQLAPTSEGESEVARYLALVRRRICP